MGIVEVETMNQNAVHEHGVAKCEPSPNADHRRRAGAQLLHSGERNRCKRIFGRGERNPHRVQDQMLCAVTHGGRDLGMTEPKCKCRELLRNSVGSTGCRIVCQCAHRAAPSCGRFACDSRPSNIVIYAMPTLRERAASDKFLHDAEKRDRGAVTPGRHAGGAAIPRLCAMPVAVHPRSAAYLPAPCITACRPSACE